MIVCLPQRQEEEDESCGASSGVEAPTADLSVPKHLTQRQRTPEAGATAAQRRPEAVAVLDQRRPEAGAAAPDQVSKTATCGEHIVVCFVSSEESALKPTLMHWGLRPTPSQLRPVL